jgi:hypothetical protein
MAESKTHFVTFCIPPDELELLDFAAQECGQTKSSFCYVLVRDRLRALGLLERPPLPARLAKKDSSNGARPNAQ